MFKHVFTFTMQCNVAAAAVVATIAANAVIVLGSILSTCLDTAFTLADPESAKKLLELTVFFALLGFAFVKAAHKRIGEIDPLSSPYSIHHTDRPRTHRCT